MNNPPKPSNRPKFLKFSLWEYREVLVLVSVLCFVFASGLFQVFPLPGWVDSGMYLGYFLNFPLLIEKFGVGVNLYHATRMPYVLPGYLLHKLSNPILGHLILVASQFAVSVIAAWSIGYRFGGKRTAFLSAALIAFNPLALSAATFGGVDGAALAYTMCAGAFLFYRPNVLSIRLNFGFGVAAVLAVSSHPFTAPVSGSMMIAKLLIDHHTRHQVVQFFLISLLGGVTAAILLGWIGTLFGLRFLYILDSLPMAKLGLSGFGVNYREPLAEWLLGAYRVLPALWLVVIAGVAFANQKQHRRRYIFACLVALVLANGFYLGFDVFAGGTTIQNRYYTNLLIPINTLAVAILVGSSELEKESLGLFPKAAILVSPVLLALVAVKANWNWWDAPSLKLAIFIGISLLFLVSLAIRYFWLENHANLLLVAGIISAGAFNVDTVRIYQPFAGFNYLEIYKLALEFNNIASPHLRSGKQILIAYNRDLHTTGQAVTDHRMRYRMRFGADRFAFGVYDTMSSLYMYDRSILTGSGLNMSPEGISALRHVEKNDLRLLVLGQSDSEIVDLLAHLKDKYDLRFDRQRTEMLRSEGVWFTVWVCVKID